MKKISFNKLERNQDELGNFTYSFRTIKDHNEGLTELLDSFVEKGYKFEQVHNSSIDTNTSIVVSINVIDMEDVNLCKEIKNICQSNKIHYEHIIIDNCSTDGTIEKIRKLTNVDKNIKAIINQTNFANSFLEYSQLSSVAHDINLLL